jgi:hypothetical protein
VRGNLIFTDSEARFLKELARNKVQFIIVGLSAAALQGAPVVTQDIDLWFRDSDDLRIRKALRKVGGTYVPPIGLNPPMFAGSGVDMFDIVLTMHGLADFDVESGHTIEIALGPYRIKVLRLERIIRSKTVLNREKDRMVLRCLKDALVSLAPVKKTGVEQKARGGKRG